MAQRPIPISISLTPTNPLWMGFDNTEEEKELWFLEQELASELERIEQKHCDTQPIGKSGNESYVDEDEEDEEEEDDNDDGDESEERDESDDEEMIDDVDDVVDD